VKAAAALLLTLAGMALAFSFAVENFPRGLILVGIISLTFAAAWYGMVGAGPARVMGFSAAVLLIMVTLFFLIRNSTELVQFLLVAFTLILAVLAARKAFGVRVPLPDAAAPSHPVLFYNPKSGGGKAERFSLAEEARARGIEPVELTPGKDLEQLVRHAVAEGADAIAMAGGDGSQAVVASIAAEMNLPYACVPAGTRNHFALDLGVDRDDVVGALDAFVEAGERRVDLAEVNGRVFVNNVSLGLYAEAVQRDGYREAKMRTLLETMTDVIGPEAEGPGLKWKSPSGREHSSGAAILVSNNRYRLGRAVGSGTRPRIDDGLLGVVVLADPAAGGRRLRSFQKPWREWSASRFEVGSDGPVPAGIDGEAASLESPLRFRIRTGVLRVRISRSHPGASPSAAIPDGLIQTTASLARIAAGRPPGRLPQAQENPEPGVRPSHD